jgi:hypothetical protein
MINEESGRKQLQSNLRYYPGICLKELERNYKNPEVG